MNESKTTIPFEERVSIGACFVGAVLFFIMPAHDFSSGFLSGLCLSLFFKKIGEIK